MERVLNVLDAVGGELHHVKAHRSVPRVLPQVKPSGPDDFPLFQRPDRQKPRAFPAPAARLDFRHHQRVPVPEDQVDFAKVVATAKVLGAPTIRVWAGNKASADATAADRKVVADDLKRCCKLAAEAGITVSTEYHSNTLTDTNESAQLLLAEAGPALLTGWQPPNGKPFAYRMEGLKKVLDRVTTVHVFTWTDANVRLPLADGEADWKKYLEVANTRGDHYALL